MSSSDAPSDGHHALRAAGLEPDPVIEAYKAGVDRTLLRENLRLSPTERVRKLIALQELAEEARRAGAAAHRGRSVP